MFLGFILCFSIIGKFGSINFKTYHPAPLKIFRLCIHELLIAAKAIEEFSGFTDLKVTLPAVPWFLASPINHTWDVSGCNIPVPLIPVVAVTCFYFYFLLEPSKVNSTSAGAFVTMSFAKSHVEDLGYTSIITQAHHVLAHKWSPKSLGWEQEGSRKKVKVMRHSSVFKNRLFL